MIEHTISPAVSVCMAVYNGSKYLSQSLDSILAQTYTNFEFVIIDDGSTDDSLNILRNYEKNDERIKLFSRENKGFVTTLNEIVERCRGNWIARMDQDDICMPNRLQIQLDFLSHHPDVTVLGSSAVLVEQDGTPICTYVPHSCDKFLRKVFPDSPFVHPSVMFSKDAFYKAGKYNEMMKFGGEDVVFFKKMSELGKLHNILQPLISYRLVSGSLSRKPPQFRMVLTGIINELNQGREVSLDEFARLKGEYLSIGKSGAEFDYEFEVAKLYLWSAGSKIRTLVHLKNCMRIRPLSIKVFMAFFLLLFPSEQLSKLFFLIKNRKYIKYAL